MALVGVAQGLSASLQTKGSPVLFPVRAHAWVVGQVPSRGCGKGNHTLMFLSLSLLISIPLILTALLTFSLFLYLHEYLLDLIGYIPIYVNRQYCVYIYIYIHTQLCVCIYVCIYVYMYVYIHTYVYMCVCVYKYSIVYLC